MSRFRVGALGMGLAAVLLALAPTAGASVCHCLYGPDSTLELRLSALPPIRLTAHSDIASSVLVYRGSQASPTVGYNFLLGLTSQDFITVWSTVNAGPGTALFTGIPLISNLKVTVRGQFGVAQSGAFSGSPNGLGPGTFGPSFGGVLRLNGTAVVHAMAGAVKLPIPLSHVGGSMGETTMATLLGNNITITHGPFLTATWVITSITSNVVTIPARGNAQGVAFTLQPAPSETVMTPSTNGGYVSLSGGHALERHTVTLAGSLTHSTDGYPQVVTMVAPLRIHTGEIAGRLPGAAIMRLHFLPEPGASLLLLCGAAALAVAGRRRMRR